MKVLGITDQFSGPGYHRVSLPIGCLDLPKEDKLITNVTNEDMFYNFGHGWDIVLFNRFIDDLPIADLLEFKEKFGFKIVCDIDDYWRLDPHHILNEAYTSHLADFTIQSIKAADLVTTTHERLAKKIKPFLKNVVVIPNALPYGEIQFDSHKSESDKVRFMYAAGITHEKDVAILRNPFKRISNDIVLKEKCEFILAGYDDVNKETKEIWTRMLADYSAHDKLNGKVKRGLPVYEYMKLYKESDVSIIPLLSSEFNSMKSNLKVLETASKKNPAIVSYVDPYKELPVRFINNQKQWYDNIKFYANEKNAREDDGNRLYEYCNEHFNLRKWSEYRKQVFEALCKNEKIYI